MILDKYNKRYEWDTLVNNVPFFIGNFEAEDGWNSTLADIIITVIIPPLPPITPIIRGKPPKILMDKWLGYLVQPPIDNPQVQCDIQVNLIQTDKIKRSFKRMFQETFGIKGKVAQKYEETIPITSDITITMIDNSQIKVTASVLQEFNESTPIRGNIIKNFEETTSVSGKVIPLIEKIRKLKRLVMKV